MQQCCCISTQDENENLSSGLSCDQEECENKEKSKIRAKIKSHLLLKSRQKQQQLRQFQICKYWAIEDYCPYGQQCAFAHGQHEIRQKTHVPHNYKTQVCKNYITIGYCCYGKDANLNILKKGTNFLVQLTKISLIIWETPFQAEVRGLFYIPRLIKNQKRSKGLPYKL